MKKGEKEKNDEIKEIQKSKKSMTKNVAKVYFGGLQISAEIICKKVGLKSRQS